MSKFLAVSLMCVALAACSSTQKTGGQGMVSVVAQNVVRIAGNEAIRDLDITEVKDRKTYVSVTGFGDDFSSGYIQNLIRTEVENAGGKLAGEQFADTMVEVAVNAAGNDLGESRYIVGGSTRSEGTVDLTITVRDLQSGDRLSTQKILGQAKYQQGSFLGISGAGAYFVLKGDDWQIVEDPAYYEG